MSSVALSMVAAFLLETYAQPEQRIFKLVNVQGTKAVKKTVEKMPIAEALSSQSTAPRQAATPSSKVSGILEDCRELV